VLTGRPGGTRARAPRTAFHPARTAQPDPHAVGSRQHTSLPNPLPSRYGYPITQDIVACGRFVWYVHATPARGAGVARYRLRGIPIRLTLRVNTHLVYLVPVTKISTRTAVRIAGTTLFTTRRCDTKAGERTPPQTRNATPHNFCAIFGLNLSCIARAFGDCQ
jgi:hypothetical protein